MIKEKFGSRLDGVVRFLMPPALARHLNPNALTVVGALVSLGAAFAFAAGEIRLGGGLVVLGGFFDLTDGVVARQTGRSTTFGAFFDSTLDRFSDLTVLAGIAIYYAGAGSPALALVAAVALVASAMVSYARARAESIVILDAGVFERGERTGVLALGALFGLLPAALVVVAVGASVTVVQRIALAYREMERLDAAASVEAAEGQSS
jgi:CDP-diacylglycerol--glycerol-3-phosphate 3-phosphatidyltransferase